MVTTFGSLKSGDLFRYHDREWRKVSGNFADLVEGDKVIRTAQIPGHATVELIEAW